MLTLSENDFQKEVLDSKGLVLVDFWAEWCSPCRQLGPILEAVSKTMPNIKFCKVNVDEAPSTAASFKDGKQIDSKVGFSSEESIASWLNGHK